MISVNVIATIACTHFSFTGTMMYFFLKMSTFDFHLRTLLYASATLTTFS